MKLLKDVGVTLTSFCLLVCPSLDKHRAAVPWYPSAGQMTYCALSTCDATLHTLSLTGVPLTENALSKSTFICCPKSY